MGKEYTTCSKYNYSTDKAIISCNKILDIIRTKEISIYQLAKEIKMSYPAVKKIVREFEFCRLIKSKVIIGTEKYNRNRASRICYIPKEVTNPLQ